MAERVGPLDGGRHSGGSGTEKATFGFPQPSHDSRRRRAAADLSSLVAPALEGGLAEDKHAPPPSLTAGP